MSNPTDLRAMLRQVLRGSLLEAQELLTEFARENPDVFRRGAQEYLKAPATAATTLPVRRELASLTPTDFEQALGQIVQTTSVEEAVALLNTGRNA